MRNRFYKKRFSALEKEYEKDVLNVNDAMEYSFIGNNYYYGDNKAGIYMKLRFFYLLKWAEKNKQGIRFEKFPVICDGSEEKRRNSVDLWSEWIQFAMEESVYDSGSGDLGCCGNLIYELKNFGWEIDEIDHDDVVYAIKEGDDIFSDYLDEKAAVHVCNMLDEYSESDFVYYILLKNERLGAFFRYMEKYPKKKNSLYERIIEITSFIENLFYQFLDDFNINGVSEKGYFSAVAYGDFPSWEDSLSPTNFDPINIIRAYYLEKFLDIAEQMYGYRSDAGKESA